MSKPSTISIRVFLYVVLITLMGNVHGMMDLVLQPEIPYLDLEHMVVGGMMAFLTTILCFIIEANFRTFDEINSSRLGGYVWFMAIVWSVIVFASLGWDIVRERQASMEIALQEARAIYEKDLTYYRWATGHEGVFVPITERTRPNRYLRHIPEYMVETVSGLKLTLVNPEYMIRQVYEMQTTKFGILGHITSLDPIRSENAADPWEQKALEDFEEGVTEVSSVEDIKGEPYLRLMRPMITETGCLKCHALQGYEEGDIRGGISVSVPITHLYALSRKDILVFSFGHVCLWILGLLGLFLGANRVGSSIREREEAEARLRAIIDHMFDGLVILDDNAVIDSVNIAAAGMFGCKQEDLIGKGVEVLSEGLVGGGRPDDAGQSGGRIVIGGPREIRGKRSDGSRFPLEVSVSKMQFGTKDFYIVMVRDISDEKIRKSEALQAGKLAAIGELAAGVAHEINNPINGVINYAQVMKDDCDGSGNQEHSELLGRLIKEGERVAGIVRNLLSFARQRDEDVDEVLLKGIIADSISLVIHQLTKEGIRLAVDVPDDLPTLRGNPQQLLQVFLNLLSNARYALNERYHKPDGGKRVEIKSRLVDLGTGDMIRTTITDYGCGIPPEVIDRIFESLFSTKPSGQGTGLGLSISRDLIRDHHGYLHVESVVNDHTTVTVDLPVGKMSVKSEEAEENQS
ncbi:MAG: DUF3365 domain-containing protein [Proteobacteria bacterium]|nr:DUF3365 domain-containing protein [Pseudomonadota bacterium]MBU1689075.1 DUF3365 domain-containing protein [Pseudomonadota bacterium]